MNSQRWRGWLYIAFSIFFFLAIAVALPGYSDMSQKQRGAIFFVVLLLSIAGVWRGRSWLKKNPR